MNTGAANPTPALWSEMLLRSMAELRELLAGQGEQLGQELPRTSTTCSRAAGASTRCWPGRSLPASRHDLMNMLSAIRGYAEMLSEDMGAEFGELEAALARLLKAVQAANNDDSTPTASGAKRVHRLRAGLYSGGG